MAVVFTTNSNNTYSDGRMFKVIGQFNIGVGTVYAAGGITAPINDPLIKAGRIPIFVSLGGNSGYTYKYIPGTTVANGKLKILVQDGTATNPLAEVANGAVAAAISSDTVIGELTFLGMK